MIIYCPECENECSDKAPACPKCGHPLQTQPVQFTPIQQLQQATQQQPQHIQTTQQTSKKWKSGILIGTAMMLLSPCFCFGGGTPKDNSSIVIVGSILFLCGLGVYSYSGIAAWWHHG